MKRTITLFILFLCFACKMSGQSTVQTLRGTVFERETQFPLPGATIVILNTNPQLATISKPDGTFAIDNVPVGRYNIQISFLGYEPYVVPEIMVGSAKEVVIHAGLKESLTDIEAVKVTADIKKDQPLNSMASISARKMNMDEAHRYAGGFDDPARLATSFAGVASGVLDDNGIIVRGNAPKGLVWHLEGVEIPNPNHFANMATLGGGGITIFSSQMLTNSDFFTGAFPAEYGNALSGVFDIKFRNGNNQNYEHTVQAGVMGIDFSSEGPFRKGHNASYLFNYRYSTFGIIKFVLPEDANIPVYQDLSFKFNFPTQKAGTFALWGLGGLDDIAGGAETDSSLWETFDDRIDMAGTINTGVGGLSHTLRLGRRAYLSSVISASASETNFREEFLNYELLTYSPIQDITDKNWRYTFSTRLNTKFSAKHTNRTGFVASQLHYASNLQTSFNEGDPLQQLVDAEGSTEIYQLFSQSKMEFVPHLTINAGVHAIYSALNDEILIEPRGSIGYKLPSGFTFTAGYGKHSQLEPMGIYLVEVEQNGVLTTPNKDLKMTKAHHFVGSIDYSFNRYLRLKIEPYYQKLFDVPVIADSSFATINLDRAWYVGSELNNKGTGVNYGLDVTFEHFLNKGYYYLVTASIFDSKYTGGDGIERNTKFNRNYILNALFGKEWQLRTNRFLSINGRVRFMGGNREIPVNYSLSEDIQDVAFDYSKRYESHQPAINQVDLTLTYKINRQNHSSSWALQVMNVLGRKEFYGYTYNYKTGEVEQDLNRVIVPSISYKIEF